MEEKYKSVSHVISDIKQLLEGQFRFVSLTGEVSNLSCSGAGHWYFTLSDSDSSISVALFKGDALRNPMIKKLVDGDKINCQGSISVYARRGTFQIVAKWMEVSGKGDLLEQYEKLKKRLSAEGLFDLSHKKPLPKFPNKVAVVTALGGAALQDFINVTRRRCRWMDILVIPALVQGEKAAQSLRQALCLGIEYHLKKSPLDIIVLTRGGGSLEDLWAFNDEALAWEIYNCPVPVVSAVGHQVDFTICDYVADLRCETPSAAAEVITQGQTEVSEKLRYLHRQLLSFKDKKFYRLREKLFNMNPRHMLDTLYTRLAEHAKRLAHCQLHGRMRELSMISDKQIFLDDLQSSLQQSMNNFLSDKVNRLDKCYELLRVLNPRNVLGRGYAYVTDKNNEVIPSKQVFDKVSPDSILQLNFYDGTSFIKKVGEA